MNCACSDLCGGRPAMGVPTAIDQDAQTLEDGLCLVFFETQFMDLMEKTPVDKMAILVRKTWKKMGPKGREIALQMKLPFEVIRFLETSINP